MKYMSYRLFCINSLLQPWEIRQVDLGCPIENCIPDLIYILANSAVPHIYLFISNNQSYASSFPFHIIFFYKNTVTLTAYAS